MPLTDLDQVLEPWLDLPIRGKTYRVPAATAATGLWCQRIAEISLVMHLGGEVSSAEAESLKLDDDEERTFVERMLTPAVYQQMLDDNVPWEHLRFAGRVSFTWTTESRDAAIALWERGGRPESQAPARKPAKKRTRK